jgi:hypothetical protein
MGRAPKGTDIRELRAMTPTQEARARGYVLIDPKARRWETPNGRVISQREMRRRLHNPLMDRKTGERLDALEGKAKRDYLKKLGFDVRRSSRFY